MFRALFASFLFSLSLLLAACGDGDGDGSQPGASAPPPASVSASGNVVKGLVRNGIVSAWRWEEGAYVQVASARTGDDGAFTLAIPAPVPGEVLRLQLDVSADTSAGARTEMLCDITQCGAASRGDWVPLTSGLGLASWASVGADGAVTLMPMTPLSTLLVSHAEALGGGHLTLAAVDVARVRVAALVGLSPAQLLARPGNILDGVWVTGASAEAVRVAVLSAAVAELARLNSESIDQALDDLAARFTALDGRLMQAGEADSLAALLQAAASLAGDDPGLQARVQAWIDATLAGLSSGALTTTACTPDCGRFDSNSVLAALGEGADTLGGDLRRLMGEQGASRIEDLITAQLARYGWLAHADTVALAGAAAKVVEASISNAFGFSLGGIDGVAIVREGNVLHFDGSYNNLLIDVDVTVPQVLPALLLYSPGSPMVFVASAKGTVQNGRVRGRIDGTLTIDASDTDFGPITGALRQLLASLQMSGQDPAVKEAALADAERALMQALAGIVREGAATFTVEGSAALAKLELRDGGLAETSQLGISGRGVLELDMNGLPGGGILVAGRAEHGMLTLPNGDTFTVDPLKGHKLTFALGADGTAELSIAAHVLGHVASVTGSGRLAGLGTMLTRLRDTAAGAIEASTGAEGSTTDGTAALIAAFLTDLKGLALTVDGKAVIPAYAHTYSLSLADGVLRLSQPDSSETALELALLTRGMVARAGARWWLLGVDLSTPGYPALTLADSQGGEWRWDYSLGGVVAAAPGGSVASTCWGTSAFC